MIYLIPIVAKLFTRTNICKVKTVLKHHYKNRPASFLLSMVKVKNLLKLFIPIL